MMEISAKIEALLFFKNEAISVKELAKLLSEEENKIKEALQELREKLAGRGIVLLEKDEQFKLGTAPEMSEVIENLTREELSKDLGKAGLETLAIILYQGPVSRSEIDYIRGVNSSFILRNLLIRGLVERVSNKKDQRTYLYKPTFELLSHLGVTKIEELPDYANIKEQIEAFRQASQEESESDVNKE